jgi:hypothetical protein
MTDDLGISGIPMPGIFCLILECTESRLGSNSCILLWRENGSSPRVRSEWGKERLWTSMPFPIPP